MYFNSFIFPIPSIGPWQSNRGFVFIKPLWFPSLFYIKIGVITVITITRIAITIPIIIRTIIWFKYIFQPAAHYSRLIFHLAWEATTAVFPGSPLCCWKHLVIFQANTKLCVDSPGLFRSGCQRSTPKQSPHGWRLYRELCPHDIRSSGYLMGIQVTYLKISHCLLARWPVCCNVVGIKSARTTT